MAKYGTFKYGDGTKYGVPTVYDSNIKPTMLQVMQTRPTMNDITTKPIMRCISL